MNYIDDIKLKMVVDDDIEVPIYNAILYNVQISYDVNTKISTNAYSILELIGDEDEDEDEDII